MTIVCNLPILSSTLSWYYPQMICRWSTDIVPRSVILIPRPTWNQERMNHITHQGIHLDEYMHRVWMRNVTTAMHLCSTSKYNDFIYTDFFLHANWSMYKDVMMVVCCTSFRIWSQLGDKTGKCLFILLWVGALLSLALDFVTSRELFIFVYKPKNPLPAHLSRYVSWVVLLRAAVLDFSISNSRLSLWAFSVRRIVDGGGKEVFEAIRSPK